jgi:S-adenosylmethionine synthetase
MLTDGQISQKIERIFDLRPYAIETRLKLRNPIYSDTAAYGHMGRVSEKKKVTFTDGSGKTKSKMVETFTWEKLDYIKKIKSAFNIK